MLDGPLPVLGRSASTDCLELVRSEPRAVEQYASIARSLPAARARTEVHERLVFAARYCDMMIRCELRQFCKQTVHLQLNYTTNVSHEFNEHDFLIGKGKRAFV